MKPEIEKILIPKNSTILFAMKYMDEIRKKLLIVSEGNNYIGLLSIGDIQRAIIRNVELSAPVSTILRKDYIIAHPDTPIEELKRLMLYIRAEFMPVVDDQSRILQVHFWDDLFGAGIPSPVKQFNVPVVIMAGGLGTRLKPLTNVLPKPLISIGEKTIIEEIFYRFGRHGCNEYFLSLNYKAELIEFYLRNLNLPYNFTFLREEKPMGTGGSLSLLKGKVDETFFVNNCDILIEQDYSEILEYHKQNQNEITIVAALKHFPIAYGTIETGENGNLIALKEKPELTFKINSGMYVLEPHLIEEIPSDTFFHITQLIDNVKARKGNIGVFPVSEKSWKDIGDWSLYMKEI